MINIRFDHFITHTGATNIDDYLQEYAAQGFALLGLSLTALLPAAVWYFVVIVRTASLRFCIFWPSLSVRCKRLCLTVVASPRNSTINGNGHYGLSVVIQPLTLVSSTVTGGSPAGVLVQAGGTVNLKNSIVAGNAINLGNLGGTFNDQGNNITSGNPGLASLADNGGPTKTHALLPNSPAINAGDVTTCADASGVNNKDQRGQPRTNDQCDIGGYELQPSATNLNIAAISGTYGGTINLSATLTQGGNPVPNQQVSFTLNGNAVGSANTNASGVATLSNASLSGINAGSYPSGIGASFAGASPFNASSGSGALTVNRADQTITFDTPAGNPTYAYPRDSTFTIGGSASSGLAVSFSVTSGPCSLSGTGVTITGVGTCVVQADQAGNANYNAAPSVSRNFTIDSSAPTITVTGGSFTYDGQPHSATATATGSGGAAVSGSFSFTYTPGGSSAPVTVGTYDVTADFTSTDPSYTNASGTGSITINQASTSTSLSSSSNPSALNQAVTLQATVSVVAPGAGNPTGTISFYEGTTLLGTQSLKAPAPA
jgi:hypothetical protein